MFSSNHLHQRPLKSTFARLLVALRRSTTDSLASPTHADYTRPSGHLYVILRGGVQSRITSFAAEMPSTRKVVTSPCISCLASKWPGFRNVRSRSTGLGPPTVLLFGESFLNSSLNDRVLSLCWRWARILSSILVVAEPEARLVASTRFWHIVSGAECLNVSVCWLRPARSGHCP